MRTLNRKEFDQKMEDAFTAFFDNLQPAIALTLAIHDHNATMAMLKTTFVSGASAFAEIEREFWEQEEEDHTADDDPMNGE